MKRPENFCATKNVFWTADWAPAGSLGENIVLKNGCNFVFQNEVDFQSL